MLAAILVCAGHTGDNGAPNIATLTSPRGLALSSAGELFIAVTGSHCVRRVNAAGTNITTVAGVCGGSGGNGGDGTATAELLLGPTGVALSSDGGTLYIADTGNNKVRWKLLLAGTWPLQRPHKMQQCICVGCNSKTLRLIHLPGTPR